MSKMSQLHADIMEQASEMGFKNLAEAEEAGFKVNYTTGRLEKAGYGSYNELDEAHEAWLKERDEILKSLERAIKFIEDCHD